MNNHVLQRLGQRFKLGVRARRPLWLLHGDAKHGRAGEEPTSKARLVDEEPGLCLAVPPPRPPPDALATMRAISVRALGARESESERERVVGAAQWVSVDRREGARRTGAPADNRL